MTVAELKKRLDEIGVLPRFYSLLDDQKNESLVLECLSKDRWFVYYSERGLKTGEREFSTEGEACAFILERLAKDPLVKMKPPRKHQ